MRLRAIRDAGRTVYGLSGEFQAQTDRESIVNLHMGIPHGNGLRDDVQLLWSTSALRGISYNNPGTSGGNGGVNNIVQAQLGLPVSGRRKRAVL